MVNLTGRYRGDYRPAVGWHLDNREFITALLRPDQDAVREVPCEGQTIAVYSLDDKVIVGHQDELPIVGKIQGMNFQLPYEGWVTLGTSMGITLTLPFQMIMQYERVD